MSTIPRDCTTKIEINFEWHKKNRAKSLGLSLIDICCLVCSQLEYNLVAVQLALVQENRWEVRLIYCVRVYLALDCNAGIVLVTTTRLCDWAATREPVAGIDHTAWL